jgi:hypothetical protein
VKILYPSLVLFLFITGMLGSPASAGPAKSSAKEPITIDIGKSSFKTAGPSKKTTSTSATTYRSTREAAADFDSTIEKVKAAEIPGQQTAPAADVAKLAIAKEILADKIVAMKAPLLEWRSLSEQITLQHGLQPNFQTLSSLEDRLKAYEELSAKSKNLIQLIDKFPDDVKNDSRAVSFSPAEREQLVRSATAELGKFQQRMHLVIKLCDEAVTSLEILKKEWGDWKFSESKGLEFESGFDAENKAQYNTSVQNYKSIFKQIQTVGGTE